jgi:hypothetical protein
VFRHLRRFADSLAIAPGNLADRIDLLAEADEDLVVATLEHLVT